MKKHSKLETRGYAARGPRSALRPVKFYRRGPGPRDVLIQILYCGICHSDIHQARNEWGISTYPMVPGHEIVGRVIQTGRSVRRFKPGDIAGVGCFVDSCRRCASCREGLEQFCEKQISWTYSGTEQDGKTPTFGGYSSQIVVNENYALKIRSKMPLERIAPLLCAGITTYSPLRQFRVGRGTRVAVAGLGGLGHMAVKLAVALGAEVAVLSSSREKAKDARRFGAKKFILTKKPGELDRHAGSFDFILNTIAARHDYGRYLELLKRDGVMALVGAPEKPCDLHAFSLIIKRRKLAGSLIGGIRETQEMLDFCAKKKIGAEVEVIPIRHVNRAFTQTVRGKVRYRFVIDLATL